MTKIKAKIQLRRDTSANFTSVNPTLLLGEFAFETDTMVVTEGGSVSVKLKIGDGVNLWSELPYTTFGFGAVSWEDITGKPTEFAPAPHTHEITDVIGLEATLEAIADSIPDISGLATVVYVDQQDDLKVDKVTGKGLSTNDFTNTLKTKLDGIQDGAEVNVNADWNATSGDAQILNKPNIPSIAGLATTFYVDQQDALKVDKVTGKGLSTEDYTTAEKNKLAGIAEGAEVNVNADWNATTGDAQILNKPAIPAAQIQSDWTQSNNAALDFIKNKPTIPASGLPAGGTAGQILTKIDGADYNANWQENFADWTSQVKHIVKNNGLGGTITKGTAVYVTGSNGTNMLVGRASNASEPTSSKTMGLMQSDITTSGANQTGFVITEGLLSGLNTAGQTAGDPVWLGVNGALIYGLANKPYAPAHLVFIGIVTKVSAGSGEIFVKVQNGFELKEIHDVDLITTTPINGHVLGFDGTLWVNKTIAGWLGFTPEPAIAAGTTSQYWRGDKSWQTLDKIAIGLGNVDNTSDANKPISTATQTALNAKQDSLGFTPVPTTRTISTTAPLSGGGDLSANRTLSITQANASNDGYLSATDWNVFNNKFSLPTLTAGSILFSNGTTIAQNNANLFWDPTNNRLGIGTATPANKLHIFGASATIPALVFTTANRATAMSLNYNDTGHSGFIDFANIFYITRGNGTTFPFYISANSNVLINTITDAGFKLDVNGTARFVGQVTFPNSSSINASGNLAIGAFSIHGSFGYSTFSATTLLLTGGTFASTSGNQIGLSFSGTFAPTSGTATYSAYSILPTINQTGGASGITRGLYINPTLTAAADFRAIDITSGTTVLAPSVTARASLRIPSGTAPTSPVNGDIWFDGTLLKMQIGGVTRIFTLI